jgi:putative tricarboxylic transport membrane protein
LRNGRQAGCRADVQVQPPRRRSIAELLISAATLALGIAVFVIGRSLSGHQGYALVGPDMMPMVVGVGLAILGAWLLAQALRGGWVNAEPDDAAARGDHPFAPRAFLWVLAGLVVQMVLVHTAGFVIAAAGLFACVCRGFDSRRWLRDLLVGFVLGLAVYLFFVGFLNVNLPAGLLAPVLGTAGL